MEKKKYTTSLKVGFLTLTAISILIFTVLWVKGRRFYCDDAEIGQILFLSVQQSKKSVEYPDYDTIIFDEFIIEKGFQRYLPDEVNKLFNFMDTVFRNRDNCRCICLANAISWVNPYFIFFKFAPMDAGYQIAQ